MQFAFLLPNAYKSINWEFRLSCPFRKWGVLITDKTFSSWDDSPQGSNAQPRGMSKRSTLFSPHKSEVLTVWSTKMSEGNVLILRYAKTLVFIVFQSKHIKQRINDLFLKRNIYEFHICPVVDTVEGIFHRLSHFLSHIDIKKTQNISILLKDEEIAPWRYMGCISRIVKTQCA